MNRRGAQAPLDILKNESSDAGSGFLFDKKMRIPQKIIEFYIPNNFPEKREMGSPDRRGKIIEFASPNEEIGLTRATRRHHNNPNHLRPMSAAVSLVNQLLGWIGW